MVEHPDIDPLSRQGGGDPGGDADGPAQAQSDHRDQGDILDDRDVVRMELLLKGTDDFLQLVFDGFLLDDHGEGVDAGGYVVEADPQILQDGQGPADESDLAVHHALVNVDDREGLLAGDAGQDPPVVIGGLGGDDGAGILRGVGVADVDGDAGLADREDGLLVEDARAHVGQLPQLHIGNVFDRSWIIDDPGVGHQKAGHIRPVLIDRGPGRPGDQGAGHIRAAPGQDAHLARILIASVESGKDGPLVFGQFGGQGLVGLLRQEPAFAVEENEILCIDKVVAQIGGDQDGRQEFPPAHDIVFGAAFLKGLVDGLEPAVQVHVDAQIVLDGPVAVHDHMEKLFIGDIAVRLGLAEEEEVGDLVVVREPFSRRGHDHVPSFGVCFDDVFDLLQLDSVRNGGSAEFYCFAVHFYL